MESGLRVPGIDQLLGIFLDTKQRVDELSRVQTDKITKAFIPSVR